jgi:uncharacterized membrane protein (DUF373 family)
MTEHLTLLLVITLTIQETITSTEFKQLVPNTLGTLVLIHIIQLLLDFLELI